MRKFNKEYKMMAVNRVKESGKSATEVARELDLSPNTLHGWISKLVNTATRPFPAVATCTRLTISCACYAKEIMDLKEENAILKKAAAYFAKNQK